MISGVDDRRPSSSDGASPVVVGSASRDVAAADPRGWRLGGAVTYAGLALARLGLGTADPDGNRSRGGHGRGVGAASAGRGGPPPRAAGPRTRLRQPRDPGPAGAALPRARRSDPGGGAPGRMAGAVDWLLVPVAGELEDAWADVPDASARVALGWQGLLRDLPRGGPVARLPPRGTPLLGPGRPRRREPAGPRSGDSDRGPRRVPAARGDPCRHRRRRRWRSQAIRGWPGSRRRSLRGDRGR